MNQESITKLLPVLFSLVLILAGCRQEGLKQDLTAEEIMDSIKNAYRECSTYQDDGTQAEKSNDGKPERNDSLLSALHIANGVSNGTALLISPLIVDAILASV